MKPASPRFAPDRAKCPLPGHLTLTADTSFEGGKPKLNSRVTVRFVATEDGDRAIHVIVRGHAK